MKKSHGQMSESFLLGALLAFSGGFLDLYTYVCRGEVFANAQTGNMIFLSLYLAQREWKHAIRHIFPIIAFALAVILVERVRSHYQEKENQDINIHWRQVIILIELIMLIADAFIPQKYNILVNINVSFVCSMQFEAFRKIQGCSLTTTMCTGNLRSGTEYFFIWRKKRDKSAKGKGFLCFIIILFFLFGAVASYFLTNRFLEKAVLIPCVILLLVFLMMFIKEEEKQKELDEFIK